MSSDIHALSGAYAVDALDETERAEFEEHLAGCESCRAEVDGLRETAALLATLDEAEPPASLRERTLAGIKTVRPLAPVVPSAQPAPPAHTPAPPATADRTAGHDGADSTTPRDRDDRDDRDDLARVRRSRRRPRWVPAAAVAAVAAVILGIGGVVWEPWEDQAPARVSTVQDVASATDVRTASAPAAGGGVVTVYHSADLGRVAVVVEDLPEPPPGKVYEMWLQDSGGSMEPAGLVPTAGDASMVLEGGADDVAGVGMTVEPAGGSPEPTSDPVALVPLGTA